MEEVAGREDLQGLQVLRGRLVLLRQGAREGRQVEVRLLGMYILSGARGCEWRPEFKQELEVVLRQAEGLDRPPARERVSEENLSSSSGNRDPLGFFFWVIFPLQNLTNILVHQAGALRLRIQEDLPRQDQVLLPITEEDAIMAVEQLLLIDLVPFHL